MTSQDYGDAAWWPLLWNSGTIAMSVIGPQRRYVAANPHYCRLLEADCDTLLSWPYDRLCHPLDLDCELDALVRLQEGAPATTYQRRFQTARGREFTATVHCCAGPQKTLLQLIIPTDAAGMGSTTAADQRAWKSLAELGNALSHDALEPVRMSTMHLSLIGQAQLQGRPAASFTVLTDALQQVRRQLMGLVDYARLGRPVISPVAVPLSDLLALAQAQAEKPVGPLVIMCGPGNLRCDPRQASSALRQLLLNAATFIRSGTPAVARIGVRSDQSADVLSVSDDGPGIPKADQPRMFRLFATGGRSEPYGPGIGLALCRAVAEGHGGCAWLVSEEHMGTTVSLAFPH